MTTGRICLTTEKVGKLKGTSFRKIFTKNYDLFYIYSNGIDSIGDSKKTESAVFSAVEDEFKKIVKLIRHVYNVNGSNILITADHGFLYQNMDLDESDFIGAEQLIDKGTCLKYNRRFVLGSNLKDQASFKKFKAKDVLIDDDIDVMLPKSINRLRIKGSGYKFVHGGMTLQEIVIPVLKVVSRTKAKVRYVGVDILSKPEKITSGQITLKLYQEEPIEDKILPRYLRVGFYSSDDSKISNFEEVGFDSVDPVGDNRIKKIKFTFSSDINSYNNTDIELRMLEKIKNTNQSRTYKKYKFRVQKTFDTDFDF